jgi:hypothetical protein
MTVIKADCSEKSKNFSTDGTDQGGFKGKDISKRDKSKSQGGLKAKVKTSGRRNITDMPEFEPIRITGIIEKDVSEPRNDGTVGSTFYNVPFQLSQRPPTIWAEYFPLAWDHPAKPSPGHRPGICSVSGDRIWLRGTTLEEVEKTHKATLLLALEETNQKYSALEAIQEAEAEKKRLEREAHERHVSEAAKKIKFE